MSVSLCTTLDTTSLISFINDNLSDDIQRTFAVESFVVLVDRQNEKYPVRGQNILDWLGYEKKNLKRLYSKHLQENVDYISTVVPSTGGRPSEDVKFTSDAFKQLCMLSHTPNGKMVRQYYIALEELVFKYVAHELTITKTMLRDTKETAAGSAAQSRHLALVETYAKIPITYLALMETLSEDEFILKIGSTNDINTRDPNLRTQFGHVQFLYVMAVRFNERFEKHLQKHPLMVPLKYTSPINGLSKSNETFKVNDDVFKKLKRIMKSEVLQFNCMSSEEELRMRELEVRDASTKAEVMKTQLLSDQYDHISKLLARVELWEERMLSNPSDRHAQEQYDIAHANYGKAAAFFKCNTPEVMESSTLEPSLTTLQQQAEARRIAQERPCTVTRGEFVQRYNADTLQLVDHFVGPTEAIREFETGCPQILMKAVKECTIYKGFRWACVPRDGDPTASQDIGETVESRQGGGGMVAVYSHDETRIECVFPDQLTTRDHLKVKSAASVSQAISSNLQRKCAGVLLQMWENVPANFKEKYLETKKLPDPAERNGGRAVLQLDMHTGKVIKRHGNIAKVAKVAKDFRMSHMTVKKACESGEVHAGFKWKYDV